jgi:mannose-6-phosphate isomerase
LPVKLIKMELYPLKFEPILKRVIWGGNRICEFKQMNCADSDIGESWELSQLPGAVSVVANGYLKGKTLTEVLEEYGEKLMGKALYNHYGNKFPLLIKFIDAEADLSIQVHPNDKLALKRHACMGKSEMWYIVDAKPGAGIVSGFTRKLSTDEYEHCLKSGTIEKCLQKHEVQTGDVFYIPSGRVHALGAGVFVAEIQESSDITYRLYDYNRRDASGNMRELHTELAKEALDYECMDGARIVYAHSDNGVEALVSNEHFTTNRISLKTISGSDLSTQAEIERNYSLLDSFVVYVCVSGSGELVCGDQTHFIKQGETLLLPSTIESVLISSSSELILLETYLLV